MRLQLALNVDDLDTAIDFYSKMFDTAPAKIKPGYANFEVDQPPLKLVLMEDGTGNTLNHLGVEVEQAPQVTAAESRMTASGLETTGVEDTMCCFADKTETWITAPDGQRWEWYVKTGDNEQFDNVVMASHDGGSAGSCCPS